MPESARHSRVDDAYSRLKDEIRTNRMPPGFQAPEPEIAIRMGMSRTPVREALIRLEAEGLVELIPRRGARVLPIRPEDMREIYEILAALEPEAAAGVAARHPSDADLAPLEQATSDMETALDKRDLDAWAEADDRFHLHLLQMNGNHRLERIIAGVLDQVHRARMVTLRLRALPEHSTREHRAILEHMRRGDALATRAAFRAHRERSAAELLTLLETYRLGQL